MAEYESGVAAPAADQTLACPNRLNLALSFRPIPLHPMLQRLAPMLA